MRVAGPNRPIGRKVTTGPPWWAAARCQLAKKQPGELLHGRPQRPFPPGVSGRTGGEAQNGHTSVHSSVDSAGKQLQVIALSLRRRFVPTAWLLCGLPLSLSFHMNATLACNAFESRKLNVPNLNSATLGSETELRSELGNASLARTAPSVEMSQVGQLFWAAARCQLARTSRENYCTGVSRARPPGASGRAGWGSAKCPTTVYSSVDSAGKQY